MKYEVLAEAIELRGIRRTAIARAIGICDKSLRAKIKGTAPFTLEQANAIQKKFFPDIPKDELFRTA